MRQPGLIPNCDLVITETLAFVSPCDYYIWMLTLAILNVTSALDVESEKIIQESIDKISKGL